jgi:hypothetical protein
LERIDNLVSKNPDYDGVGTTEPSSAPAPIRNTNDDSVGQLRAIERAAATDTRNSDDDSVGPTEPLSPPAPIRNDNLSDDESVGQLRNIERAAAQLLSNGGPVPRESCIVSGSKTKSQKKQSVKHGGSNRKGKRTSKSKRRHKQQGVALIPSLQPSSPETDTMVEGLKDSDSDFDMGGGSEYCLSKTDTESSSSTNSS